MIITIARQCGSGGLIIGQALAKHYGIPLYAKEHLQELARKNGTLDFVEDFFNEFPVNSLLSAITQEEGDGHVTAQMRQLLANLVGDTDCVITGRCGNYIFRDRKDCVTVFLKGDIQKRIDFMTSYKGIDREDAKEYVERTDESRRAYHNYYTGETWGDAANYDICLDSNRLGFDNATNLIINYTDTLRRNGAF